MNYLYQEVITPSTEKSNDKEINDRKRKRRSLWSDTQLNETPGMDETPTARRKSAKRARLDYLESSKSNTTKTKAILSDNTGLNLFENSVKIEPIIPKNENLAEDNVSSLQQEQKNTILNSKDLGLEKVSIYMTIETENYVEYSLPFGWKKTCKRRSNKRTWDISVMAPSGKKLRSNPELYNYLEANPEVKCDRSVTNTSRPSRLPIFAQKPFE